MASVRMAMPTTQTSTTMSTRLLAWLALLTASLLARRAPLRFTLQLARMVKRLVRCRPADTAEAARLIAARDWAAARFPGRSACLESSLAAFLLSAIHGRAVDWCVGCRFRPAASHAWIETGSGPVGEPTAHDTPFHVTIRI